jgi:pimeloyl-ACP methyl ester carboxylesterase
MTDWIEANGASLRYELSGQGNDVIVLIHELGGTLESWDLVLPALQEDFQVLRYDQRGFGLSEKTRGKLSLTTVLDDLLGLLDGLGMVHPCGLIGSALGAGIAIAFAARYPKRVARLVACNPATGVKEDRRAYHEWRAESVEREGMRAVVEESLNKSYPEILRGDARRFDWYRRRWLANDPSGFAAINRMLPEMDLTADFARITCPTLVLAGLHDGLIPPAKIRSIAQAIPGALYAEVNSGHFMAVQGPEEMLEHALPFLRPGCACRVSPRC